MARRNQRPFFGETHKPTTPRVPFHFGTWSDLGSATDQVYGKCESQNLAYLLVPDLGNQPNAVTETEFLGKAYEALERDIKALVLIPQSKCFRGPFASVKFGFALNKLLEQNCPFRYRHAAETRKDHLELDPFNPRVSRQIWVHIPLLESENSSHSGTVDQLYDHAWQWWTQLRKLAGTNPKLGVILEFGDRMPLDCRKLTRWFGERFRASIIPDRWIHVQDNLLQLPIDLQQLMLKLFCVPHNGILLRGGLQDLNVKLLHLIFLYDQFRESMSDPQLYDQMVMLPDTPGQICEHTSQNYTKDKSTPKKYEYYNWAISKHLEDRLNDGTLTEPIVGLIIGAGRGFLVNEFANVVTALDLKWQLYCIDQSSALVEAMTAQLDGQPLKDNIQFMYSPSLRKLGSVNPELRVDIIMSEIVGPFDCNDCLPEVLDEAQRFLKPDGIIMPWEYDTYLQPVMAIPYSDNILTFAPADQHLENELVSVSTRNLTTVTDYQKAWTFTHPSFEAHTNEREITLTFVPDNDYVLTGFTVHFDIYLHSDFSFNNLPDRHTTGLSDWFPGYLCLKESVEVSKGSRITVNIARRVREATDHVWYEWALTAPKVLPWQNFRPDFCLGTDASKFSG